MSTSPASTPQITPLLVAVGIACVGPVVWVGLYTGMDNGWIAAPLIGLLIGIGLRTTMKHGDRRLQIAASALTAISCVTGYLWTDLVYVPWIVQPGALDAVKHLLNDITAILLIALGAYIAWVMAALPAKQ